MTKRTRRALGIALPMVVACLLGILIGMSIGIKFGLERCGTFLDPNYINTNQTRQR